MWPASFTHSLLVTVLSLVSLGTGSSPCLCALRPSDPCLFCFESDRAVASRSVSRPNWIHIEKVWGQPTSPPLGPLKQRARSLQCFLAREDVLRTAASSIYNHCNQKLWKAPTDNTMAGLKVSRIYLSIYFFIVINTKPLTLFTLRFLSLWRSLDEWLVASEGL